MLLKMRGTPEFPLLWEHPGSSAPTSPVFPGKTSSLGYFIHPWALLAPALQRSHSSVLTTGQVLGVQGMEGPCGWNWGISWLELGDPTAGIGRPHCSQGCLGPAPVLPWESGNPQESPGHPQHSHKHLNYLNPPLLAALPMSQPLALEGIQECWWQTGTQTNSQPGLFLIALIVPLMEADKVTSPLCCFCLVFYLFLSL